MPFFTSPDSIPEESFVFRAIRAILRAYWITLFNFTAR